MRGIEMNKKSVPAPKALFISCIAVSLLAVIFRILLTATVLETDKHGLYTAGSPFPALFHIFLGLAAVAFVFISVKTTSKKADSFTLRTMPSNIYLGVLLLVDALGIILNILTAKAEKDTFIMLELAFALVSAVYIIGSAARPNNNSPFVVLTALTPIAFCAVCLVSVYFDSELLMTDPGRILRQVAFLSAMLAFLSCPREKLGIFSHKLFLASTTVAPIMLLASAVPDMLFRNKLLLGSYDTTARSLVCIGIALYFIERLYVYAAADVSDSAAEKGANL